LRKTARHRHGSTIKLLLKLPHITTCSGIKVSYAHVAAGMSHTVLLKNDGTAVGCGTNIDGQLDIPNTKSWKRWFLRKPPKIRYVPIQLHDDEVMGILQAYYDGSVMQLTWINGEKACDIQVDLHEKLCDIHAKVVEEICSTCRRIDVILPGGQQLNKLLRQEPDAELSTAI